MTDRASPMGVADRAELVQVTVHAYAALRRRKDALDALRPPLAEPEALLRAVGDGTHAVLSLYLAAAAAQRYCERTGEVGPLGLVKLGELVRVTGAMRDAIMHWDEKGKRDSGTSIVVDTRGVEIVAPDGKHGTAPGPLSGFAWSILHRHSRMLLRWAAIKLGMDPAVDEMGIATAWPWTDLDGR